MERRTALLWIALSYVLCLTCSATTPTIENVSENAPSKLVSSLEHETSVPVHDNRFIVDKDIQSIQIIINTDDVQNIKILGPAGFEIMPLQNTPEVNWQQIDKLYAITLKRPAIGQWEIKGKMQATPKIIIDSTLKMITPDFPNNLFRGETLSISAYLTDNNKRITSNEILSQTQFFATLHNIATLEKYKIFLSDEEARPTGVYRFDYALQTLPGVYRLTIQATSLLFQRQQEQQFYLYDYPATYTAKVIADTDELLIEVDLQSAILDEPTCHFSALYMGKDGDISSSRLTKIGDKKWQLFEPITDATYRMNLLLNAYTIDRRLVNITFPDVDVFAMYQKNLTDVKALWDAKWETFWLANQLQQIDTLLPFSREKNQESWLFEVNQGLPKDAIALRKYETFEQSLLKAWEPVIFGNKNQALIDEMNAQAAKDKAIKEAKEAKEAKQAAAIAKAKEHEAKMAPWRKLLVGLIVVFGLLFIGLIAGALWVFKKEKVLAIFNQLRVALAKGKEHKDKLQDLIKQTLQKLKKEKPAADAEAVAMEATAAPETAAAPDATAVEAIATPDAAPAEVEATLPDAKTLDIDEVTKEGIAAAPPVVQATPPQSP